ncbi:lysozyme [Sphingomonas sp. Leaf37]|uniref:lysozyme n=1 Tax=Sphingomonas sp. Leaf37 TaxID=2876552 RepID=UPI001E3A6665|nr:lysozyme [Sphingomonas sp. Leaf37]
MADAKKTLVGVLGSVAAAAALFTSIPAEESGRKVAVTIAPTGEATIRHISGPQYLRAYLDAVKVATICDGLTAGVRMGQVATPAQCTARLEAELVEMARHVVACVPALYGRPNQAAAAVSLAYNIGWPSFCKSTVARRFNAGQWAAGCDAFTMWVKAGGRTLAGLVARRGRERALCLTGI